MGTTRHKPAGVTEIFSEYVRQRQHGLSQQAALEFLKPILQRVRSEARQQLAALIRSWEAREGAKYQPQDKKAVFLEADAMITDPAPEEDLSWLPQPASPSVSQGTGVLESPVHPSMEEPPSPPPRDETFYCPSCGRANRLGEAYCYSCGALLNVTSLETRNLDPITSELQQVGQSHFGRSTELLLHVRGADRPFAVPIRQKLELTLGRNSLTAATKPDIDLSPFQAVDYGVSRLHARLRYQDDTITIADLGSVNHTYVNGQRLHPHEVRVLRDGDEIRLGRLAIQVAFHHQVRPLE
mgnify:CR=1 FL=1